MRIRIFVVPNNITYITYVLLNANTIKDGDEEAWTRMLPGNCDISSVKAYRQKLLTAKPDP